MALQCVAQPVHPASLDTGHCVQHFVCNDISGQCCLGAQGPFIPKLSVGVWVECSSDTESLLDAKPSQTAVGRSAVPLVDARPRADHRGR